MTPRERLLKNPFISVLRIIHGFSKRSPKGIKVVTEVSTTLIITTRETLFLIAFIISKDGKDEVNKGGGKVHLLLHDLFIPRFVCE